MPQKRNPTATSPQSEARIAMIGESRFDLRQFGQQMAIARLGNRSNGRKCTKLPQ
jgi:hypothetical protein